MEEFLLENSTPLPMRLASGPLASGSERQSNQSSEHEDNRSEYDLIDSPPVPSIHSSISALLFSDKFSDMTIRCDGREFKAHRAIVCTQSRFFDAAFSHTFQEATTRVIDLPEDDADIVERFLEFIYTGNYTDGVISTWDEPSNVANMTSEEVQEELGQPPGVSWNQTETGPKRLPTEFGSTEDPIETLSSYSEDNDVDASDIEEPEEEYDEDYGQSSHSSDDDNAGLPATTLADELFQSEEGEKLNKLASMRNDVLLHLRIYVMADKYDVPALRLLARDRFYRAAEIVWADDETFPDVVEELYRTTNPADTAMRDIVCRLVGSRIVEANGAGLRERLRPVMTEHGAFAVGVMEYVLRHNRLIW